ncbi:hypothetical protein [Paraglaciecola hydrolytica]|nr:hypothetical protein [Paraglaciecola hydrolytica]
MKHQPFGNITDSRYYQKTAKGLRSAPYLHSVKAVTAMEAIANSDGK